jgi:phosphoribosylamine---glycine ligase
MKSNHNTIFWGLRASAPRLVDSHRNAPYRCQAVNILVIGSGGREHAIVWKLRQSREVNQIWCSPGNAGIARQAACRPVSAADLPGIVALAEELRPDLTVVGPEVPLVLGLADEFRKRGLKILGPGKDAARLEGSKVFAKEFMRRHAIPTASLYGIFDSPADASAALRTVNWPLVLKADGVAAGKGVLVTSTASEAADFITRAMESQEFGEGGKRLLMEEGLEGRELSYIILTDGSDFIPMAPARDYKRVGNGNTGPNTGGMGSYSTAALLVPGLEERIQQEIVRPTIEGMTRDGCPYRGFLYFGLMLTATGPKVLEYNCRLGDPETQAILPRLDSDFAMLLAQAESGSLENALAAWKPGVAVCVVLAAAGYPGTPQTGDMITGIEDASSSGAIIFHSATKYDGTHYISSGGRVLGVVATAGTVAAAARVSYAAASQIHFTGMHFRADIGD